MDIPGLNLNLIDQSLGTEYLDKKQLVFGWLFLTIPA